MSDPKSGSHFVTPEVFIYNIIYCKDSIKFDSVSNAPKYSQNNQSFKSMLLNSQTLATGKNKERQRMHFHYKRYRFPYFTYVDERNIIPSV